MLRHQRLGVAILVSMVLGWAAWGCAGSVQYGSFLQGQEVVQASLAADAVHKINALYPPSSHSIQIRHMCKDPFGQGLLHGLRNSGYQVLENHERSVSGYHGLSYVLDRVEGTSMLRLKLEVDEHTLSRAYVQRQDGLYPVGAWSSVEGGASVGGGS